MQHNKLMQETLSAVPMPLILIDPEDRVIWANRQARDLFGESVTGLHYAAVLRQQMLLEAIERTLEDAQARSTTYVLSGRQNEITYRAFCAPCPDLNANPGAVLVSFEDISHIEEATQMRQDFVANVSHELRTPLTALIGFVETLRGAARDDAQAREKFLAIMEREATRMSRLVGDLLSLSRVEADEHMRPKQAVDIVALVATSVTALRPVAEAAGAVVKLNAPSHRVVIQGDSDQLQQVFSNLIENAIKYGRGQAQAGARVAVSISVRDSGPYGPFAQVEVADQGDGIAAIHIPRLTERFYRIDAHRSREMGGTGLGLAIVKHIVNRHRGRLRIASETGQGSRFTVEFPLEA